MPQPAILLSVPGLREKYVAVMPRLRELMAGGAIAELTPSFPCVTCPVQANMTTGPWAGRTWGGGQRILSAPKRQVRDVDRAERLHRAAADLGFAIASRAGTEFGRVVSAAQPRVARPITCARPPRCTTPTAPSRLWCYTRPAELYGMLRDSLGHFPLMNYWGPKADVASTAWIADSAVMAARQWQPDFFYIYLPHLDYAAQRNGPESVAADTAVAELDEVIGRLVAGMARSLW